MCCVCERKRQQTRDSDTFTAPSRGKCACKNKRQSTDFNISTYLERGGTLVVVQMYGWILGKCFFDFEYSLEERTRIIFLNSELRFIDDYQSCTCYISKYFI